MLNLMSVIDSFIFIIISNQAAAKLKLELQVAQAQEKLQESDQKVLNKP